MNKYDILRQYFGHETFREGQNELIDHIVAGGDVLGIMPTGAGKSLCYQIPALMMDGVTLVVSPLISLMKDQVNALVLSGVKAAYLNSSLTAGQYAEAMRRATNGAYQIIYVAPERLLTEEFIRFAETVRIAMITVDEAHCVSQWGQDFRPSYLKIMEFADRLPYRPIISAFTATATVEVREDIIGILQLRQPLVRTTGFDRRNLHFEVRKPENKLRELLAIVRGNAGKSGIVYALTRKTVEEVCAALEQNGYAATRYHAGLSDAERHANQDDFLYDRKPIMVATNAFGMGIDKSNVSYVVHYNMPRNLEGYYQEAGRAGRDGEPADCIVLYGGQDVRTNQFLIDNNRDINEDMTEDMREEVRRKDRERLKAMTIYCTTTDCLRAYILRYFGETSGHYCGHCSNCNTQFEAMDITAEAQCIVQCVQQLERKRRSFGKTMIADILRGSRSEKLLRMGLEALPAYGALSALTTSRLRMMLDELIERDYLMATSDEFPVIRLSERAADVLVGGEQVTMKLPKASSSGKEAKPGRGSSGQFMDGLDQGLFAALKALRSELAAEARVPAYLIFNDATLREMCQKQPLTEEQFLSVSGVGQAKLQRYGERFIEAIRGYTAG